MACWQTDKSFFISWNRKLNNNICDRGNEWQGQRNQRSFVLKFILAYNIDILTETNIPMKELPQTNDKNTSMHGFQQEEDQLVIDKWGWVKNKSMWQWAAQKLCSFGCSLYSLYNWFFFSFCYPECIIYSSNNRITRLEFVCRKYSIMITLRVTKLQVYKCTCSFFAPGLKIMMILHQFSIGKVMYLHLPMVCWYLSFP